MDQATTRVLIHGASGRMGRALLRLIAERPELALVAAVSRSGKALAEAPEGVPVLPVARLAEAPDFDLAIDFSLPEAFEPLVAACRAKGAGLVSGTTGLSSGQLEALDEASELMPVLWSANFSVGVAVLRSLVHQAAAALPGWDADIVESHHVHKKDAPSGTALSLGKMVEQGRGSQPHYASLRCGDVVGEHLVQFTGPGERLELVHRASDRDIFARGALEAAVRLSGKGPGRYDFGELLLASGRT
ncbi:MAG TPA: 4-hydroxy-tetrahydrodipicolinate reductase [Arenimonas sp.]|nr:4-hydroxy-tetrahydrodipicolinate reductase [Arenimonas sp.]